MEEERERQNQEVVISEEALKEAEKYIEEKKAPSSAFRENGCVHHRSGW
jgi:hypothetical protein